MELERVEAVELTLEGQVRPLVVQAAWLLTGADPRAGGVQWRRPRPGGAWRLNLDRPDAESYVTLMRLHRELDTAGTVTLHLVDGRTLRGEAEAVSVAPGAAVLIGCSSLEDA